MTAGAWVAAMAAAVGALLVSYWRGLRWLTWVSKPLASTIFVAAALASGCTESPYGKGVLSALLLSWLGDVLLIPRSKGPFLAGLIAFLMGHLAFGGAFLLRGVSWGWAAGAAAALVLLGLPIGRWLLPQVTPSLKGPVAAYIGVLSCMVALAAGTHGQGPSALIAAGAVGFYFSDLSVALDRFVAPGLRHKLWGTPLYFFAQLLFAFSTAGGGR